MASQHVVAGIRSAQALPGLPCGWVVGERGLHDMTSGDTMFLVYRPGYEKDMAPLPALPKPLLTRKYEPEVA